MFRGLGVHFRVWATQALRFGILLPFHCQKKVQKFSNFWEWNLLREIYLNSNTGNIYFIVSSSPWPIMFHGLLMCHNVHMKKVNVHENRRGASVNEGVATLGPVGDNGSLIVTVDGRGVARRDKMALQDGRRLCLSHTGWVLVKDYMLQHPPDPSSGGFPLPLNFPVFCSVLLSPVHQTTHSAWPFLGFWVAFILHLKIFTC